MFFRIALSSFLLFFSTTDAARQKSNLRPFRELSLGEGYELTKECIIQLKDSLYFDGTTEETIECELDPADTGGIEGIFIEIKDENNSMADVNIVPGKTTVFAPNSFFVNGKLELGTNKVFGLKSNINSNRKLSAQLGTKTILVVKVNASGDGGATSLSEGRFADSVFGNNADGDGGDAVNLKSQFAACSHGKLNFRETTYPGNGKGVITIDVDKTTADGDEAIRNAVTSKIFEIYGVNAQYLADHVMYCLPEDAMDRIAYGFFDSWLTVYKNKWCSYVSAQMHELGHNFGLGHSNELGEYNDRSGIMGWSYSEDDAPLMCFNNAKNWELGWYSDRHTIINPLIASWMGELVGVSDYGTATSSQTVVLKIKGGDDETVDYYVGYNKAAGFNSGTREGANEVTVQSRGRNSRTSELVAELSVGDSYKIPGLATIVVYSINNQFATVTVQEPSSPTENMCDAMLDLVWADEVCVNNVLVCEASANLGVNDNESCDSWCERSGLTCEIAWDDSTKDCGKIREIPCSRTGNRNSICRCTSPLPVASPTKRPTKSPTSSPTKSPINTDPQLCDIRFPGSEICFNSPDICETKANLSVIGNESCDFWCGRKFLFCDQAWDDSTEGCGKIRDIPCSRTGNSSSICRCTVSRPIAKQPTKSPTKFPTKLPISSQTKRPSRYPTKQPTKIPTRQPTRPPTSSPIDPPSNNAPLLCDTMLDLIWGNEVCLNNVDICEATANLSANDNESCDSWCERSGLTCDEAWDDSNVDCGKRGNISCSESGKTRSICRCKKQQQPLLCEPLMGLISNNDVCLNTMQSCEATANLGANNKESCDSWCERSGFVCDKAWNDGRDDCEKLSEISCNTTGNSWSICRCILI